MNLGCAPPSIKQGECRAIPFRSGRIDVGESQAQIDDASVTLDDRDASLDDDTRRAVYERRA
jgi:hypothetical protein